MLPGYLSRMMSERPAPAPPLDALLATKLYIPAPRPNRVPRPRLTQRLEAGASGPFTLVSAPAGFGKSTLLSEWIQASGRSVAWVSLDEGDNDLVRFLCYLVTALQKLHPGLGDDALTTLRHAQSPDAVALQPVLTGLLNEIHALGQDLVVVLDAYHVIETPEIHQAVQFLLDRLPPRMHVVVATRVDPPLLLSRLRARGQLTELRARDLRFTSQEAADFLNQAMGLTLSAEDVEALEQRTEGWAVGLQMAALSLQGRADVEGFIGDFTGSHRYVLDYLTEEVLSRQPEPVREFLLRSSVLSRLSAPLSAAVTGRDDAQAILERLDATNLFLIPLDDTRTWYRYHHLFGTLLRHQLERQEGRPAVVALHERASQWYSDHGHPEDALEHALAAGAMDRATELVTEHALPRLMRADAGTVIRWIRSLPAEWLERRPKLRLSYAWALVSQLELKAAEEHVDAAERALEATPDPELAGHVEVLRGMLTRTAGRNREAVALYRSALTRLPEDSHFLRGVLFLDTGTAWLGLDDLAAAGDAFEQARTECARSGNTFCVLLAEWHLAELYLAQGHLHKAAELARSSLRIAEGRDGQTIPAAAMARGILADVRREWDDLPGAVEEAAKAWELGKRGEIASGLLAGSLSMSRVLSSLGDFPGALAALGRAEEVIRRTGQPHWLEAIHSFRAGVQLRQARVEGNAEALEAASRWARDSGLAGSWRNGPLADTFNDIHRRDFAHLVTARVLLADGDLIRAEELLAALLEVAEETGRAHSVIEGLSLTALARNLQGDRSGAVALVGRALALAEPERYVRLFADEDPALAGLIEEAAPDAVSAEYARKILEAFGMEGPAPVPGDRQEARDQEMAEPLSDREVEVLRLIATGLSNADAGRKLFIAPSTVKKHLENIYAKLGTRNRTQAIARARDIGVL